jgi:predicted helicase
MVILGNPPYSGHSANKGQWIAGLLRGMDGGRKTENYFACDGKPLGERNSKWLNDDYVKFIRFAQWRIEQADEGILGFVTNHGYLDNPTFRGMRESLLHGFDEIYVLDLHGNSKKKETAPDHGKDENVFDIQQGVAIGLFVRHKQGDRTKNHRARVYHADLYGDRGAKYERLGSESVESTEWRELAPDSPAYYFVPQDGALLDEYEQGWKITEAMPDNVLGFQTHRDGFAIDFDLEKLQERIEAMRGTALSDAEYADKYGVKDNRDWHLREARSALRADRHWKEKFIRAAYRPFDERWGYFSKAAMDRPRSDLVDNVVGKNNLCLNVTRNTKEGEWRNAVVSDKPAPAIFVEVKEGSTCIPLWLYPQPAKDLLEDAPLEKRANFAPGFLKELKNALGATPSPEDTLAYIYAILYAPSYRARYADFLKRDFPRVPLTPNARLFAQLVKAGGELIALHTMQSTLPCITGFPVAGTNQVADVRFAPPLAGVGGGPQMGRIWINEAQYFDAVPPAVWEVHIGGYRVAEKWLKDRKGRQLSSDDLTHYQDVIAALARTLELQAELDQAIGDAGGWPQGDV